MKAICRRPPFPNRPHKRFIEIADTDQYYYNISVLQFSVERHKCPVGKFINVSSLIAYSILIWSDAVSLKIEHYASIVTENARYRNKSIDT